MKTTSWKAIKDQRFTKEEQAEIAQRAQAMIAEMPLQELRQARAFTQSTLAVALEVAQSEVSQIEKQTDVYIGTLRRYIEAMGGELDIVARFPDGSIRINQFAE
jgi:predicted XRE-type DNA-binding protein